VDMFLVTETIILSWYENGCGFSRETTGSSKVALEKYILISNQAIRKSRQVNHYLRYATLKS